jgi:hypothetical protein
VFQYTIVAEKNYFYLFGITIDTFAKKKTLDFFFDGAYHEKEKLVLNKN